MSTTTSTTETTELSVERESASAVQVGDRVGTTRSDSRKAVTESAGPAVTNSIRPITNLQLHPLAKTGVDPLDNAVGTQVADFQPVSTAILTDPLTSGGAIGSRMASLPWPWVASASRLAATETSVPSS